LSPCRNQTGKDIVHHQVYQKISAKKKTHRGDAEDTEREFEIKNLRVLLRLCGESRFSDFWVAALPRWVLRGEK
jgi:hypothetical protein